MAAQKNNSEVTGADTKCHLIHFSIIAPIKRTNNTNKGPPPDTITYAINARTAPPTINPNMFEKTFDPSAFFS